MKTKRYLSLTILLFAAIILNAEPRSKQAITKAAMEILNSGSMFKNRAPRHDSLVILKANEAVTIMGYRSGGFAVIGNDDRVPAILAYSDKDFNCFKDTTLIGWVEKSAAELTSKGPVKKIYFKDGPSWNHYPESITPFVSSRWGQRYPYNAMCPILDSKGNRALTGCVATAMAKIIRYNRYPKHGQGKITIYPWYRDESDRIVYDTISVDFSQSNYDYDNMLDSYNVTGISEAQVNAVAKLMLDCGVACNMSYGLRESVASAAFAYNAFKRNFGYSDYIRYLKKKDYSNNERSWMSMIYDELSNKRPVLYFGYNSRLREGHAFVIDGYDVDGRISVEGVYYDIQNLKYPENQEMIIGLRTYSDETDTVSVDVKEPGTLSSLLPDSVALRITALKVAGKLNSADIKTLRNMACLDINGHSTNGNLVYLDMSNADIIADTAIYLNNWGTVIFEPDTCSYLSTKENQLPEKIFYGSTTLRNLILPESLTSIGTNSLSNIVHLDSVHFGHNFPVIRGAVYSPDTTVLIRLYKGLRGTYKTPRSVLMIREDAFNGCAIDTIRMLKNVRCYCKNAMAGIKDLKAFYVYNITGIELEESSLADLPLHCQTCYITHADREYELDFINKWGKDRAPLFYGVYVRPSYKEGCFYRYYKEDNSKIRYEVEYLYVPDSLKQIPLEMQNDIPLTARSGAYTLEEYPMYTVSDTSLFGEYPFYIERREGKGRLQIWERTAYINLLKFKLYPGPVPTEFPYTIVDPDTWAEIEIPDSDWKSKPYFKVYIRDTQEKATIIEPGKEYEILYDGADSWNYDIIGSISFVTSETEIPTNIENVNTKINNKEQSYNLLGQPVSDDYKGIIIKKGKKYIRR